MMKSKKLRVILASSIMILMCVTMIIGGTYSLWSDEVNVENHLSAGSLDVKLERISLTKNYLDSETGYLVTTNPNLDVVDFSNSNTNNDNIFGISENEKVVPGIFYEARLRITNNGDVAFEYDVIVILTSVSNALAEQLKVFVDGEEKGYLSEYVNDGQAIIATQTMAKNDRAKEFVVKIVFDNLETNNAAQNQEVIFDLLVNAVQKTNN